MASGHDFTGQIISNWQLKRLLGEGSFGAVYEADHTHIKNKRAAVKVLHPHLAVHDQIKRRFINEASNASRAEHENIVQIFDGGVTSNGVCYCVMELLRGTTLAHVIPRSRFSIERVVKIGSQIASALVAAHEVGIVHRDLKPENIFLTSRATNTEFVKVLDFGIAKLRDTTAETGERLTATDMPLGTPGYMSPEQWMTERDIDGRADIYALGIVFYECLTGELPFSSNNRYGWQQAHLYKPVPDLATRPGINAAMALLIKRMVAKRREERPQGMIDVIDALRSIMPTALSPTALDHMPTSAQVSVVKTVAMATTLPDAAAAPSAAPPSTMPTIVPPLEAGGVAAVLPAAVSPKPPTAPTWRRTPKTTPVVFPSVTPETEVIKAAVVPALPPPEVPTTLPIEHPPRMQLRIWTGLILLGLGFFAAITIGIIRWYGYKQPSIRQGTVSTIPEPSPTPNDGVNNSHVEPPQPLTDEEVKELVKQGSERLQACHTQTWLRDPKLPARLSLQLTIEGDGHVSAVSAAESTDGELTQCLDIVTRAWRFRTRSGEPPVTRTTTIDLTTLDARGHLLIVSNPSGALVIIDGKAVGNTPMVKPDLDRSKPIDVLVRKPGFRAQKLHIRFDENAYQVATFEMRPSPQKKTKLEMKDPFSG